MSGVHIARARIARACIARARAAWRSIAGACIAGACIAGACIAGICIVGTSPAAHAASGALDGASLSPLWGLPFIGILLSIALFPLLAPRFWHASLGLVALFWTLAFLVPFTLSFGVSSAVQVSAHVILSEYLPFIALLSALFIITGGMRITGLPLATPASNTGLLGVGTLAASWIGTTGASMLLIRPLLSMNRRRKHRMHVHLFLIFLVANIGGALTPLGDPPLFLGFLKGVDFFWTTRWLFAPMLLISGTLLMLFYILDRYYYLHREEQVCCSDAQESVLSGRRSFFGSFRNLGIQGGQNLVLLLVVVLAVLMSGLWSPQVTFPILGVDVKLEDFCREMVLVSASVLSLLLTSKHVRRENGFGWFPILEVAKLFSAIFLTLIPVSAILQAGEAGAFAGLMNLLNDSQGQPREVVYFWSTGILSAFLDNAPTYLVFFNAAGGDADVLTGPLAPTLLAISAGAVFMGANTYIGNAPNFMIRSIAEQQGIAMPSFFSYMALAAVILLPVFALFAWVFLP